MDNSKLPRDIAETFLQIGAIFLLMIVAVIVYLAMR
jgi:hypothetical protein